METGRQFSVSLPTCMSTTEGPWKVSQGPSPSGQLQISALNNGTELEQEQLALSASLTPSAASCKELESSSSLEPNPPTQVSFSAPHQSSTLVRVDRAELVTINNKNCGTASDLLSSSTSSQFPFHVEPASGSRGGGNHAYNAVFLVDGLHKGIRIDQSDGTVCHCNPILTTSNSSASAPQNKSFSPSSASQNKSIPSAPAPQNKSILSDPSPGTKSSAPAPQNKSFSSSPVVSIPPPAGSFGLPPPPVLPARTAAATSPPTEATCIRIQTDNSVLNKFTTSSSSLNSIPNNLSLRPISPASTIHNNLENQLVLQLNNNESNSPVFLSNNSPALQPHNPELNELRLIVPSNDSQSFTSSSTLTSTTPTTRVVLPVPTSRPPTTPTLARTNPESPPEDSVRTLISTEAQTDDLPARPPAPQAARTSREHRKRERRERHLRRSQAAAASQQAGALNNSNNPSAGQSSRRTREAEATEEQLLADNASDSLPDLLNSHQPPPPYSTLPGNLDRRFVGIHPPQGPIGPIISMPTVLAGTPGGHMQIPLQLQPIAPPPPPPPVVQHLIPQPASCLQTATQAPAIRYHFSPTIRANRGSMRGPRSGGYTSEDEPKTCCGMTTSQTVSIRWFIVIIAVIGICCTVVGTTLGAAYSNGREHLTLSLLMIGVGVVLLTVSAVAWRLTSHDMENSCPSLLGFTRNRSGRGDGGIEPNRRFVPRLAPSYGRPHHPYAAMMYPEFQYRPPPPSYQASMQEYRLRLLLLERSNPTIAAAATLASTSALAMAPPPPAYRPYTGTLRPAVTRGNEVDLSRPPSYRSRSSGNNPENSLCGRASLDPAGHHRHHHHHHHLHHVMLESPLHSRNPSLLSYLSQQSIGDNVSVVSGHGTPTNGTVVTVMQAVSVGMDLGLDMEMYDPEGVHHHHDEDKGPPEVEELAEKGDASQKCCNKDGNLVRIVQTTDSSQVIGRDSVIVTVSGSNQTLWDQSLQQANNQHNQTLAISHHQGGTIMAIHNNGTSLGPAEQDLDQPAPTQVQILAHL